jgi:aminopeptidase N
MNTALHSFVKAEPARGNRFRTLILAGLGCCAPVLLSAQTTSLDVVKYELSLHLNLEERGIFAPRNTLSATAKITFTNTLESSVDRVPVVLNRLLRVEAVRTGDGRPLGFSQRLTGLEEWELYQANAVTVSLDGPLPPGDTLTLGIDYAGGMDGVQESGMLYVQESLDPDFTIIRAESSSYPHLAEPTRDGLNGRLRGGDAFKQVVEVTVPDGLVVASGLELTGKSTVDGWTTWAYQSREPSNQIVLPVGPYEVIESGTTRVYHFSEDRAGAELVSQGIDEAMALYETWFGALHNPASFVVVEIPEWHGSQALRPTIIQEATAFRDASGMVELYHEISHLWNVKEVGLHPSRWNEGLAMYLMAVTAAELEEPGRFDSLLERYVELLRSTLERDTQYQDVPLAQAGERDATSAVAYSGGGIFFGLLHRRIGRAHLLEILKDFLAEHRQAGATTMEFADFILSRAPEARQIFDEWFLGSTYADLVLQGASFEELAERYTIQHDRAPAGAIGSRLLHGLLILL